MTVSARRPWTAAAGYLARADLRRRWPQAVALAVLGGLALGISLGFLAGARRTATAYDRHLAATNASHLEVNPGGYDPESDAAIRALPGVEEVSMWGALLLLLVDEQGQPYPGATNEMTFTGDGRFYDMDRVVVSEGRLPRRDSRDEAAVNQVLLDTFDLEIGDRLTLRAYAYDENFTPYLIEPAEFVRPRIVGVMVANEDIVTEPLDRIGRIMLSPAHMPPEAQRAERIDFTWYGLRLTDGFAGVPAADRAFRQAVAEHNRGLEEWERWISNVHLTTDLESRSERGVRPLVVAVAIFGGLAIAASVGAIAVASSRLARRAEADLRITQILGLDRREVILAGLAIPLVALAGVALVGSLVAGLASVFFPVGPFDAIEPSDGFAVDAVVLGFGLLATVLVGAAVAALALRRTASPVAEPSSLHPSRFAAWMARSGLPLPMVLGARQALEPGRGRTAVPTRSTVAAMVAAVLVLVAAVVFAANLRGLESDTARFGWNADAVAISGAGYDQFDEPSADAWFEEHGVSRWRYAKTGRALVDGRGTAAVVLAPGPEDLSPTVVEGRAPAGAREVVLGRETMDDLDVEVGDPVRIGSGESAVDATVIGAAVFPLLGGIQTIHTSLGEGVWLHPDDAGALEDAADELAFNFALLDLAPGTSAEEVGQAIKRTTELSAEGTNDVLGVLRPPEVATAVSLDTGQVALALVLVLVAVLVLAVTLSSVVRRRGRDLAVHRVLGFTSIQVGAAMSWQSLLIAGVALVFGLPLGVAAGSWMWAVFADQIHVVADPIVPVAALAVVAAVLGATALAVSVRPALRAAGTTPVRWLRAE